MKIPCRVTWLALALAVLVAGFASPLLAAETADKITPPSSDGTAAVPKSPSVKESAPAGAGSATWRIAGTCLRPRNGATTFTYSAGGYMYATSLDYFNAPINLPQGAVVTSVRMYYYDTNITDDCVGYFTIYDASTQSIYTEWGAFSSGSAGLGYVDIININHTIDYTKYSYIFGWYPGATGSSLQLGGFQVFYTPPPGRTAVIPLN